MELAMEWVDTKDAVLACIGWATLGDLVSITDNSLLDIKLIKKLLLRVKKDIDKSPNRVKYVMNNFVICVGSYIPELNEAAKQTALEIGKVKIDMGDTACKIPWAPEYIDKVERRNADESAYIEAPKASIALRENIAANFPSFGYYKDPLDILDVYKMDDMGIADAVDDLHDIIDTLLEVQWRMNNTSYENALWHLQYLFKSHLKSPLLGLLRIASQKNFIAVYHMGIYCDPALIKWFTDEYPNHCKRKLDMGKSCIRFKYMDDIPYKLIGELASKMTPAQWIEMYERGLKK
eukprot:gene7647-biopygen6625